MDTANRIKSPMVHGAAKQLVKLMLWSNIMSLIIKRQRGIVSGLDGVRTMMEGRKKAGHRRTTFKYATSSGRWFWDLYSPGWPSRSFNSFIVNSVGVVISGIASKGLQTIVLGVTQRCVLSCKHCYEAKNRNRPDVLSLDHLKSIVDMVRDYGVSQIQFSGGEPLMRYNDICELMQHGGSTMDYWILTSGYGLTPETAHKLKNAGLTGVCLSCDHWDPQKHSEFRGYADAFTLVLSAASAACKAGLMLCLSLCATRSFVSEPDLERYAELARSLGAGFIQVLEPRAVGGFAQADIALSGEQIGLLERFYERMNFDPRYAHFPAVCYHGYNQRRVGCFGAGERYLYIDPSGEVHACPFCQGSAGNCLREPLGVLIGRLRARKCHAFPEPALSPSWRAS